MKRQPDSHTDSGSGLPGSYLRLGVLAVLLLTLIHAGLVRAKEARPGAAKAVASVATLLWQRGRFKATRPKPPPDFSGEWIGLNANISLTLKLEQSKNELKGTYNYVTLPNAARIREGRLAGFVRGNVAEVLFENQEYENERGKVRLIYDGAKLTWETTDAPGSDSRLPVKLILKRKLHLPRSHRRRKPAAITKRLDSTTNNPQIAPITPMPKTPDELGPTNWGENLRNLRMTLTPAGSKDPHQTQQHPGHFTS